jgi:hypothetical protein
MEMSQGNSLCSYLKQTNKKKSTVFPSLTKEQKGRTGPAWEGGWYRWEREGGGERVWEGKYDANTVSTCM